MFAILVSDNFTIDVKQSRIFTQAQNNNFFKMNFIPSYRNLLKSGELKSRVATAKQLLSECRICPRECKIDRTAGNTGVCRSSELPIISSYTAHYGEEPVLSGTKGAGNIFFGNCNLSCVYCQNHEISQNWKSETENSVSVERLAEIMLELQAKGCHNIGLISPTHFSAQIIEAIFIAAEQGLSLPIIYNSNGYDSVETLKLFEGIVDIYLPDFKYGNDEYANRFSNAPHYFRTAKNAIREMYRQVGSKMIYENDILMRGMIVRHLVLPNDLAESEKVFEFIAGELSNEINISVMSQYFPTHIANENVLLDRKIRQTEYEKVISLLSKYNLEKGWVQDLESSNYCLPNFNSDRTNPFSF
ncbi:MAG: radical SAM protein [Melioribacteraceae bacterium]